MCQAIKEMLEDTKTEGIEENKKETAINFYKNGVSKEIIAKSLNITIDEVDKIVSKSVEVR